MSGRAPARAARRLAPDHERRTLRSSPRIRPMDITRIIDAFGYVIYVALALLAIWGVYNAILLYRGLARKSLVHPAPLLERIRDLVHSGKTDSAIAACQEPTYWHAALAQL